MATEVDTVVTTSLDIRPGPSARPTEIVLRTKAKPKATPVARMQQQPTPPSAVPAAAAPTANPEPTAKPTTKPTPRPTPKPTPTPKPSPPPSEASTSSREDVKAQIRQAWGGDDAKAIRVADCESGLDPQASSPSEINLGLWQITKQTWQDYGGPGNDPRKSSALVQTQVAWRVFGDRGWSAWEGCA